MTAKVQAKHKVSRRLGVNLWGDPKSPFNTRPTKPGQHGKNARRKKISSYGTHLIEKQKIQFYYDMKEKQFKRFFKNAYKKKNVVETFFGELESRLDTVVFRAKWAPTIFAAKQMVKHRHVLVNGKLVNISSYLVKTGDVISLVDRMKNHQIVLSSLERANKEVPAYYETSTDDKAVTFLKVPTIAEIPYPFELNPSLLVEFYSRKM
ncbi:30S ribosomal protein S4 [Alphaproteobacteria bacterium endosymbiont of Tiliacea citrago]|uniref:30S ribosomal protein S4 n=1 Tax=Alphaproteobacteria bacterium endosymbiont of Tiliacea citrago TaxID=3077944 RepID=UPI00313E6B82